MNSGVVLLAAIPITLSGVLAFFLPRFSRGLLGPAVIVVTVIAVVMLMNRSDLGRDAWGPALAVIGIFVGAVGFISGLILIGLGSARAKRVQPEQSVSHQPYSRENPYRMPGPGFFTPKRLFIFIVGTAGVLSVIAWIYSWLV